MVRFRVPPVPAVATPLSLNRVSSLCTELLRPAHLFMGPGLEVAQEHVEREDISWEVFRGRLLDPAHTRQRCSFEAWNLYQLANGERSSEPLLSLKLDGPAAHLHVVRGLDS